MQYHHMVVLVVRPRLAREPSAVDATAGPADDSFEAVVIDAKRRLETLYRIYYLRHGFDAYDALLGQYHCLQSFQSLKALRGTTAGNDQAGAAPSPVVEAVRSSLVLAATGLRRQAAYSYLAAAVLGLLRGRLDEGERRLLTDFGVLPAKPDSEADRLVVQHVESSFPIDFTSVLEDPEVRRVGKLLAAFKDPNASDGEDD